MRKLIVFILICLPCVIKAQQTNVDSTALRLIEAGFVNIRSIENNDYQIFTIENDEYKLPVEGFAVARHIIEQASPNKPVYIIGLDKDVPQINMHYDPKSMTWEKTTRRLGTIWNEVKNNTKQNSSFGKINLVFYPQLSFKNYTIYHIYKSLWVVNPAFEIYLWPGFKATYQLRIPLFNDGYDSIESTIHTGFATVSQSFRDPWNLNILGKLTFGSFNSGVYGLCLDLAYYFPNERFWLEAQGALLGKSYFEGLVFHFDKMNMLRWYFGLNYYMPSLQTQFSLRAQQFLGGDKGLKFDMIRHNQRASIGLYAEKSIKGRFNVGFRFQFTLPPYHKSRKGNIPKITTGGQMGISYNAGNERYNYKEFKPEASSNILNNNYFNPYFLDKYF